MLQHILNLKEVQVLEKNQQKEIKGNGWFIDCGLGQNFHHPCCTVGSSLCG